jgi:hypothetical protein
MDGVLAEGSPETAAVFRFLSETLDGLGPRIERIEAHAAHMVAASPGDRDRMVALQDLDLIRQVIEDLSRLAGLAGMEPPVGRPALHAALKLAALRDALFQGTGSGGAPENATPGGSSGLVEFFPSEGARPIRR